VRWEDAPTEGSPADETPPTTDVPLIIRAYERTQPPSRTQEFLRVLPRGETHGLLPHELGPLFSPPLPGISVRQKVNNARKLEKKLGVPAREIVRVSWDSYGEEGAGRYFLSESDHDVLHEYLKPKP
jgi:hypothetical protein